METLVNYPASITEKEEGINKALHLLLSEYKNNPILVTSAIKKGNLNELQPQAETISSMFRDIQYVINLEHDKQKIIIDYNTYIICKVFSVTLEELRSKNKQKNLPAARQLLCYYLDKEHIPHSVIYQHLNYANHTSVLHSVRKVNGLLDVHDRRIICFCNRITHEIQINAYLNTK